MIRISTWMWVGVLCFRCLLLVSSVLDVCYYLWEDLYRNVRIVG